MKKIIQLNEITKANFFENKLFDDAKRLFIAKKLINANKKIPSNPFFKNKFISLVKNEIIFFKNLKKIISPGDNIIFLGAGKSAAIAERFCKYSGLD